MGLTSKNNCTNGGKQTRNHKVLYEKTRFLHAARVPGEYGARLSQSRYLCGGKAQFTIN
jgi:hypothetical protein